VNVFLIGYGAVAGFNVVCFTSSHALWQLKIPDSLPLADDDCDETTRGEGEPAMSEPTI
jgi:hypothetical protein